MLYLARLDSILDIYEVRNELISQLKKDLKRILDDHFLLDNTYDTLASFLMHNMVWEGDWIDWIQLKMQVLMRASGQRVYMTIKWWWNETQPRWDLLEVTHRRYE